MDLKAKVIRSMKGAFNSIRVNRIHPTGILLTRLLILIMILPIILVIAQYIMSFIAGYVSDDNYKIITIGLMQMLVLNCPSPLN